MVPKLKSSWKNELKTRGNAYVRLPWAARNSNSSQIHLQNANNMANLIYIYSIRTYVSECAMRMVRLAMDHPPSE